MAHPRSIQNNVANSISTHFQTFLTKLPEYFAQNGWKNPRDINDTPFQFVMGDKLRYFDYLSSKPYYQNAFNTVMTSSYRRSGKKWFEFFPVEKKLQVQDESDVLLVDVGGGHGSDLLLFRERFPDLPGKLILQDLPHVIETAAIPSSIVGQGHDFFDEQPLKGAKAYYLRTVLHDWPDAQVVQILTRLRDAMDLSSLLLIEEKAMPEKNLPLMAAVGDMSMMVSFASAERTEREYGKLLEEAGLELVKCWAPQETFGTQPSLLEAKIKA
jgi:hypothetical protein